MDKDKATKRRPGAKPKGPITDKRRAFTTRITEEMRERLEQAAAESGRSISQETELMLESAFERDIAFHAMFGSAELNSLFKMLAAAADIVDERMGKSWKSDYETFVAMKTAWEKLINGLRPDLKAEDRTVLAEVREADPGPSPTPPTRSANLAALEYRASHDTEPGLLGMGGPLAPEERETLEAYEREEGEYKAKIAVWDEQRNRERQLLQKLLDGWDRTKKVGEQAADEALFPPPQGNG